MPLYFCFRVSPNSFLSLAYKPVPTSSKARTAAERRVSTSPQLPSPLATAPAIKPIITASVRNRLIPALSENLTKQPLLRNFLHPLNREELDVGDRNSSE